MNPYAVIEQFEHELCQYTGARYAVAVSSCSAALFLSLRLLNWACEVEIPCRTYVSVAQSIKLAGYSIKFIDLAWRGAYQLKPLPVWDCARRFTDGMYRIGEYQCVSFASSKILGVEQGGAVLTDDEWGANRLRKMRFDGRTPGKSQLEDEFVFPGYHMPMLPSIAAQLLLKLSFLPRHNEDLPQIEYPDLSKFEVFK